MKLDVKRETLSVWFSSVVQLCAWSAIQPSTVLFYTDPHYLEASRSKN